MGWPGGLPARLRCVPTRASTCSALPRRTRASPLAVPLFPTGYTPDGFTSGPGLPASWLPGTRLALRGRLGNGFRLPEGARRLALACLGRTTARLRPLVAWAIERGGAVALYDSGGPGEAPYRAWPAELEIYPLDALPEAVAWADFLALDVPLGRLEEIPRVLGVPGRPACPAQVLVDAPFPCGGIAECGVCAVRTRRGWKLACKDGPVFDLADLALPLFP